MGLLQFLDHHAVYIRPHRNSRMSAVEMYHQLKILVERHRLNELVMLMLMFHLNIVVLLLFHANEVHDFHSEINKKNMK